VASAGPLAAWCSDQGPAGPTTITTTTSGLFSLTAHWLKGSPGSLKSG
jgi:hypothetical protein